MVRASLAVCVLMAAAPSCPDLFALTTHGFTPPTVEMTTASAAQAGNTLQVNVTLTALNPNPYPLSFAGIDWQVSVDGATVFSGQQPAISVPESGGQTTVQLAGVLPTQGYAAGDAVSYVVSGTAHVDSPAGVPVDVEFSDEGTFVVPGGVP
ncbi:MAG TPA: LEA type 2 family protein [Myxococcales bacterium]|nr:LEA type 2 family protein [Myxococcales bacterium]